MRLINDIKMHFNNKQNTVHVTLDIQKVIYRIWIEGAIYKLYTQKLPLYLCTLLQSYLIKINSEFLSAKAIK